MLHQHHHEQVAYRKDRVGVESASGEQAVGQAKDQHASDEESQAHFGRHFAAAQ